MVNVVTSPHVLSINVGRAKPVPWGSLKRSAIDKWPVDGPVKVRALGLDGDQQADRNSHGGVDQAVYVYSREDLDWWAARLGRELRNGQFGENLTITGLDITRAVIGTRLLIGNVTLELSAPRIPCVVFQGYLGEERWVRRFTEQGRPGGYCRVLEEGSMSPGDPIAVIHQPAHGLTVGEAFRALTGDRTLVAKLLTAPELPDDARGYARKVLERTSCG